MTIASGPTNDDVDLLDKPEPLVANDNEPASRGPRPGPSAGEAAPRSIAIGWRYPEAPMALATALGEIAADLWLAGKLHLTEGHIVATLDHSDAALQDDADQERDREAANLGT